MNSHNNEQFKLDDKLGSHPRSSVYELLVAGYSFRMHKRATDGINSHDILRLELSKNFDLSIVEFTIADQFEMVLFYAKTKLDYQINLRLNRKDVTSGSDKTAW